MLRTQARAYKFLLITLKLKRNLTKKKTFTLDKGLSLRSVNLAISQL